MGSPQSYHNRLYPPSAHRHFLLFLMTGAIGTNTCYVQSGPAKRARLKIENTGNGSIEASNLKAIYIKLGMLHHLCELIQRRADENLEKKERNSNPFVPQAFQAKAKTLKKKSGCSNSLPQDFRCPGRPKATPPFGKRSNGNA